MSEDQDQGQNKEHNKIQKDGVAGPEMEINPCQQGKRGKSNRRPNNLPYEERAQTLADNPTGAED